MCWSIRQDSSLSNPNASQSQNECIEQAIMSLYRYTENEDRWLQIWQQHKGRNFSEKRVNERQLSEKNEEM
jgi:gamma-glutamyl:cysteine ligase YbdK (ATP-grasp superfamily)